jgi:hypothetical protein
MLRRDAFLEVKTCSEAIFAHAAKHGKSPWILRCRVSAMVGVDYSLLISVVADEVNFLK